MDAPSPGVYRDQRTGKHVVVLVFDPEECENVADGLDTRDMAFREMYEMAAEARRLDNHTEGAPDDHE